MSSRKLKILLLMGGPSAEHEVSLSTGQQVMRALDQKKYAARSLVIPRTGFQSFNVQKLKSSTDLAFIAMHGEFGEDGRLQALLDTAGIPYVGSGVLASALAMDKVRAAHIFRQHGLTVPWQVTFGRREWRAGRPRWERKIQTLGLPVVVKPTDRGSSIGVTIVSKFKSLKDAVTNAARYSDQIMAEEFIRGRELTCGVLDDPKTGKASALPPTEIIPRAGAFYDYRSKYADGGSDHLTPPPNIPKAMIREIQEAAVTAHRALGCRGMSRSDFIFGPENKLYILETNTIPGMTRTSLLPQAAAAAGIPFPKLLDLLIQCALR